MSWKQVSESYRVLIEVSKISIGISSLELTLESKVLESGVQNWFCDHWNDISGIKYPELIWNHKSWNQMSGIGFGITSLGIKCLELVLESLVLESNVRNWFWNHKSWNQVSGFGIGNTCLGIRCLGIRCPNLHWIHVSWNYMPFVTCLRITCPIWFRN